MSNQEIGGSFDQAKNAEGSLLRNFTLLLGVVALIVALIGLRFAIDARDLVKRSGMNEFDNLGYSHESSTASLYNQPLELDLFIESVAKSVVCGCLW